MKVNCPLLVVSDLDRSRRFYEDVLFQKVVLDFGANITFGGGFCLQTEESWARFIQRPRGDLIYGGLAGELYFEEEDFDNYLLHLSEFEDLRYVHNVVEFNWGQRAVRFFDPDLHIIEVGESMAAVIRRLYAQGLGDEEVCAKSQMPLEYVLSVKNN